MVTEQSLAQKKENTEQGISKAFAIGNRGNSKTTDTGGFYKSSGQAQDRSLGSAFFTALENKQDGLAGGLPREAGKDVGVVRGGTKVHTRKKVGIALVSGLRKAGLGYEADEIENCRTTFITYRCGYCGTYFGLPITCKQRLCPRCGSARAEDIWERHKDKLLKAKKPKHLILTFKSVEHISPEYIRWVFACWNKLWHRKFFKQAVYGVLVSVEFTHTPGVGWHPHLHCYLGSEYIPKEDIEKAWCEITGGAFICRIKEVCGKWHKAIKEIVKYPTKVVGFYQEPELLSEFVEATKCVHLVRGYGEFYKIRYRKHLKRGEVRCPVCGETDYLDKIGDYEPIANFVREQWGWRFKPGGVEREKLSKRG